MKKGLKIALLSVAAVIAVAVIAGEVLLYFQNKELKKTIEETAKEAAEQAVDKAAIREAVAEEILEEVKEIVEYFYGTEVEADSLAELLEYMKEGFFLGEIHDIYDDTAVLEAYRTGDTSDLSEEDLYVLETAKQIIEEQITEDMTDYEKELAIYNWQVAYVSYDESAFAPIITEEDCYTPYLVFKNHEAICVGNATTFKLFMDMLDIPCMIIHSTEMGEHAWNLVCLDEEWYHVDVTFDSGWDGTPGYDYFNVTDVVKADSGYPWDPEEFPAAEGIKYNYGYLNALEVDSVEEALALTKEKLEALEGGTAGSLFIKSPVSLDNLSNAMDRLCDRLMDDNFYCYLQTEQEIEGVYLYNIFIENDNYDDDWNDKEMNVIEMEEELNHKLSDLIDSLFEES